MAIPPSIPWEALSRLAEPAPAVPAQAWGRPPESPRMETHTRSVPMAQEKRTKGRSPLGPGFPHDNR